MSHLFKPQYTSQGPLLKVTWPGLLWTLLGLAWCGPEVRPLLLAPWEHPSCTSPPQSSKARAPNGKSQKGVGHP